MLESKSNMYEKTKIICPKYFCDRIKCFTAGNLKKA